MNSSLTAQVRPDKNGKLVTRHVKTDAAGGRTAPSMPVPKLASAGPKRVTRDELIDEVANIIAAPPANPTRYTKTPSLRSVMSTLESFEDDSVIELIADAMKDPERSPYTKSLITSSFHYGEPSMEAFMKLALNTDKIYMTIETYGGDMHAQMNSDFSNLSASMGFKNNAFKGPVTDEHVDYFKATLIANKLGIQESAFPIKNVYYRQIEMIKENFDRIVPALPVLVPVLSRDYYKESYDDIANVLGHIETSGHDPKDIGDVMVERHTQDLDLVEEILGNGVKSMSSGVL